MEIAGIAIDETVDITDKVCPLTFVKSKGSAGGIR